MTDVFADSFFFLAAVNTQDYFHARAIDFSSRFDGDIFTTEWVLVETANALAGIRSRAAYAALEDAIRNDRRIHVIPSSDDLLQRAVELFVRCADKEWSLTDCTSFIVMKDQRLVGALTADTKFEEAGFTAILK
jgi:predicted nucleic acid-binding protein